MKRSFFSKCLLIAGMFMLCNPKFSKAYSVLTHEAIVDALWEKSFQPLLKQKYPAITAEQLKEAHAYAYGGAIAPDMGYFPFGSFLFTNLVHYVRSGDLVNALLDEARDMYEYSFALGFMCHYMSDKYGHFLGTNRAVPIVYPKLMKKFGTLITYEDDKISHRRMEFSFDVLQTAKGNYASEAYHDFIGFKVSRPVLERAFVKTYGLAITSIFKNLSFSIEMFRWSVNSLFPLLTKTAWVIKKDEILKSQPTATSQNFRYKMSRANYKRDFSNKPQRPGFFAYSLSWLILVLPKIGPLRVLKLKAPGPEAEKVFIQSFDTVLVNCASTMKMVSTGNINLNNINFDTGNNTAPGEYKLADVNYGNLLLKLSKNNFDSVSTGLKQNIIDFYSQANTISATKKELKERKKITLALDQLKMVQPIY